MLYLTPIKTTKNKLPLTVVTIVFMLWPGCLTNTKKKYEYDTAGYYYKLLSFEEEGGNTGKKGLVVKLNVVFKTQSDSIFWDSYNNLNDHFYLWPNTSDNKNMLTKCVSRFTVYDSVCMLMKPADFFRQQFNLHEIPFFSKGDSVVKIYFKITKKYTGTEFKNLEHSQEELELKRIEAYFGSRQQAQQARDQLGVYWVQKPSQAGTQPINEGDLINLTYQGYFLNGRPLEKSPQSIEFVYGTPDQLLKGINYIIGNLKVGQSTKIILPSQLAFGEKGSSNGTVPPFTPLVYDIKINEIQQDK